MPQHSLCPASPRVLQPYHISAPNQSKLPDLRDSSTFLVGPTSTPSPTCSLSLISWLLPLDPHSRPPPPPDLAFLPPHMLLSQLNGPVPTYLWPPNNLQRPSPASISSTPGSLSTSLSPALVLCYSFRTTQKSTVYLPSSGELGKE